MDFIPFPLLVEAKIWIHSLVHYQEKTELYKKKKKIQALFFPFLGKEIPAETLTDLIYFDFLILNHHFPVFYAETVQ